MRALSKLIYVVTLDVAPEWEEELDRWYREEHLANLLAVPGYQSARRYEAVEGGPKYAAIYEIDSMDAYRSSEHEKVNQTPWSRRIMPHLNGQFTFYEQMFPDKGLIEGTPGSDGSTTEGGLLLVRADVEPADEQDFNDWYDQEHLFALAKVPGCLATRRFRAVQGTPKYMAVYHLAEPEVQTSAAWQMAIDTPWSARSREAFRNRWRTVYKPIE